MKIVNNLKNWFVSCDMSFHIFSWVIPAILPIIAVYILIFVLSKITGSMSANNFVNIFMNFVCQLLYFSFLLLINNSALYYYYEKENQTKKDPSFAISIFIAIIILLCYVGFTLLTLVNCKNCGVKTILASSFISILCTIFSIYLYSKNINASFNIKNDEGTKLSNTRACKTETLEEKIKSN